MYRVLATLENKCVGGVMVSIVAFQAVDPGSIPGRRIIFFEFFFYHTEFFFYFFYFLLINTKNC